MLLQLRNHLQFYERIKGETGNSNAKACASRLTMAGVDTLTIAALMGHRTIQMTKRYAHLAPAHNQAAVDRLVLFQMPQSSRDAEAAPPEQSATVGDTELRSAEAARAAVVN